jgi:hypothetical protein
MKRALSIVFLLTPLVGLAQAPQAAPAAAPQPGAAAGQAAPAGRGGRAPLTPRILSFAASPVSIRPGESFLLSWGTEAGTPIIDNGIGPVPLHGTIKVTPKATTTYTLGFTTNADVKRSLTVTVAGTTPISPADAAAAPRVMARIDGKPDFSGMYGFTGMAGLGRGAGGGAPAPTPPPSPFSSLPTQVTLKPGVENRPRPTPAGGTADCMPLPADAAFGVPYPFQVIQTKTHMVILNEYPGNFRVIPIDVPHRADAADDPTWMGDSVGRWDGDTFVIDTVGYNGKKAIGGVQQPSEKFRTIERLTPIGGLNIYYEIVYEDPEKAVGQWRKNPATYVRDSRPGVNKVVEFVCENNRDYIPLYGPEGPPPPGAGRGGRGGAAAPAAPAGGAAQPGQRQ